MSKQTSSCNFGSIVMRYMPVLMQVFNKDLPQYDMRMLTSKCLNTAVMIFFMYLGEEALEYTKKCSVPTVKELTLELHEMNSQTEAMRFKNDLLDINSGRMLYYVMITDGRIQNIETLKEKPFPGHVLVIEKIPAKTRTATSLPTYMMYQSYIRNYKLKDHARMNNNSLEHSYSSMVEFANNIIKFFDEKVWTTEHTEFWKKFVHVDESRFENCNYKDIILFCYQAKSVNVCLETLRVKMLKKRDELSMNAHAFDMGNIEFFDARDGEYPIQDPRALGNEIDNMLNEMSG